MGTEIERKFLVVPEWRPEGDGALQRQGYLAITELATVRVRIEGEEGRYREATLCVKGEQRGLTRAEFEYPLPVADAEEMFYRLCGIVIEKRRHHVVFGGRTWEVDVFYGENEGLVTAEVELESEEVELPPWVGEDVSRDFRYTVACLSRTPFAKWKGGPGVPPGRAS